MNEQAKVMLNGNQFLDLEMVQRDKNGNIFAGRVINGQWDMEIRDGEVLCKAPAGSDGWLLIDNSDPDRIVSRFPFTSIEEMAGDFLGRWENESEENAKMVEEERDKADLEYLIDALNDLASSLEGEERQICWDAASMLEAQAQWHAYVQDR